MGRITLKQVIKNFVTCQKQSQASGTFFNSLVSLMVCNDGTASQAQSERERSATSPVGGLTKRAN